MDNMESVKDTCRQVWHQVQTERKAGRYMAIVSIVLSLLAAITATAFLSQSTDSSNKEENENG